MAKFVTKVLSAIKSIFFFLNFICGNLKFRNRNTDDTDKED